MDDRDRAYFGRGNENEDTIGYLWDNTRAVFGRSYAAEPEQTPCRATRERRSHR